MTTAEFTPVTLLERRVLEVAPLAICLAFTRSALKSFSYKMLNCLIVTAAKLIINDCLSGVLIRSADQEIPHILCTLDSLKDILTSFPEPD